MTKRRHEKKLAYDEAVAELVRLAQAHAVILYPDLEEPEQGNMARHLLARAREELSVVAEARRGGR